MSKAAVLYDSLANCFKDQDRLHLFTEYSSRDSPISLRLLDWLVTNYAKKHNIVYALQKGDQHVNFNMFLEYKAQLKAYSKKFFDPFCRRERVTILNSRGEEQQTTVAQLNFFRWALQNKVIDYALLHKHSIEIDMLAVTKKRNTEDSHIVDPPKKRRELSSAAIKMCTKTMCHITVRF